jgi:hypothetical protein
MLPFVVIGFLMLSIGYVAPCVFPPDLELTSELSRDTDKMNCEFLLPIQIAKSRISFEINARCFLFPSLQK